MAYQTTPPEQGDQNRLKIGATLVMKNVYIRWNELIGSRWYISRIFTGITPQTKILPEEKYVDPTTITVYVLRSREPRHAHFPPDRNAEWEVSEKCLFEFLEPLNVRNPVFAGPFI